MQMEDEKKEHVQKLKKMEAEMEQVFELKVKEKLNKLKDSEVEVSFYIFKSKPETVILLKSLFENLQRPSTAKQSIVVIQYRQYNIAMQYRIY